MNHYGSWTWIVDDIGKCDGSNSIWVNNECFYGVGYEGYTVQLKGSNTTDQTYTGNLYYSWSSPAEIQLLATEAGDPYQKADPYFVIDEHVSSSIFDMNGDIGSCAFSTNYPTQYSNGLSCSDGDWSTEESCCEENNGKWNFENEYDFNNVI